jgi:hypothetical protein
LGDQAAEALTAAAAGAAAAAGKPLRDSASSGGYSTYGSYLAAAMGSNELRRIASSTASSSGNLFGKSRSCGRFDQALPEQELSGYAAAIAAETAAFEKGLKQRVMLAVDHFNKDYKKGFQFLQVRTLCWVGKFVACGTTCCLWKNMLCEAGLRGGVLPGWVVLVCLDVTM